MKYLLLFLPLFLANIQTSQATSMGDCESVIRAGNESMAYNHCVRAAQEGNPKAQMIVGMALMTGVGILKDPAAAVGWFTLSADQKYPGGLYNLALAKMAGMGTPQDESGGMLLMQKAAEAGEPQARDFLERVGVAPPEPKQPIAKRKRRFDCNGVGCGKPMDGQPR